MKHKFQFSFEIVTTCETCKDETGYNVKVGRTVTTHGGDEFPTDEKGRLDTNAVPIELFVGAAAARKVEQLVEDLLNSRSAKESFDHECDLAKIAFQTRKAVEEKGGDK